MTRESTKAVEVFYSYAHKDEKLRNALVEHLSTLRRQGYISEWHDRQIVAGTDWAQEIDTHLHSASLILLLISPSFIASDYGYGLRWNWHWNGIMPGKHVWFLSSCALPT